MNNPFEVIEARLSNIETLLLELKHKPNHNKNYPEGDLWFNLKELCEYLPDKPTKTTIYSWVQNRLIPYHKGAKKLRFLKSEIDAWMKEGKKISSTDPARALERYLIIKKGNKK